MIPRSPMLAVIIKRFGERRGSDFVLEVTSYDCQDLPGGFLIETEYLAERDAHRMTLRLPPTVINGGVLRPEGFPALPAPLLLLEPPKCRH